MPDIVGIRFKNCGKIYDFEVNGLEVAKGDAVVVESELGLSLGTVVVERHSLDEPEKELKKVLRRATEDDLRQKAENRGLSEEAMAYCIERVMARGLPMKMICTEVTLDRKRFIFYFTADGRIDFRELVKDLAARFKTRIEMRQVGVRDASKVVGGLGICGREFCCKTFLTSFEPISIRMAKSQELVLNANKLSGVCGRLMCCLGYEYTSDAERAAETVREKESAVAAQEEEGTPLACCPPEEPVPPARSEAAEAPGSRRERNRQRRHSRPSSGGPQTMRPREQPPLQQEKVVANPEKDEAVSSNAEDAAPASQERQGRRFHRRRRRDRRPKQ